MIVEVLELHLDRHLDGVEHRHLVRRADERALGRRAVVAGDVDDQRVVELAHVLDRLDHPPDLAVGVGEVGGVDVGLPDEELLLVRRELVPRLQQVRRPGGKLGGLGDHPEPLLVGVDGVAELVPSLVEQMHVADLVDPLRRRVVRRMRPARRVVDEERLLRRQCVQLLHVADRLVRHGGDQVEALLGLERIDLRRVAEEIARRPLARVAAHEAVEIVEAHAGGPLVERPRHARSGSPACCGSCRTRRCCSRCRPGCWRSSPCPW